MGLFRRTPRGRHALGAAVTSIPSGPRLVTAPLAAVAQAPLPAPEPSAPAEPTVLSSIAELIASGEAWESDLAVLPPVVTDEPAARRVSLGFRDGTSASLDPDSEQALALELLAQSLSRRD